eukprot:12059357-Heterocapsa_arctica.AAC.1
MQEALQLKRKSIIRTHQLTPEREHKINKSEKDSVNANQRRLGLPKTNNLLDNFQVPPVIRPGGPGELEGTHYSWEPD